MAKQIITITISDGIDLGEITGLDCNLNVQVEEIAGSQSCLVALAFRKNFESIMNATAKCVEDAQNELLKSKGLH
ncbi:hypothetical protein KWJ46_003768 [Salmonella enterica subsp. enterica]|nr:hypothetical protein [Salmonella enterica subsp. enterica]EHS8059648.1 hypothetical protein [Salmonella enterica subsp. enterica]